MEKLTTHSMQRADLESEMITRPTPASGRIAFDNRFLSEAAERFMGAVATVLQKHEALLMSWPEGARITFSVRSVGSADEYEDAREIIVKFKGPMNQSLSPYQRNLGKRVQKVDTFQQTLEQEILGFTTILRYL
jgi:hypothetical protein